MNLEYFHLEKLQNIYLEDSFVLDINITDTFISFYIDFVLCENHPQYTLPKTSERYCFKKGFLTFKNYHSYNWVNKNMRPSYDLNNQIDYGNIDSYYYENDAHYLEGDWGEMIIYTSTDPIVEFNDI